MYEGFSRCIRCPRLEQTVSSVLTIWKSNREFFAGKSIQQILAMCGDGQLRDDNATSTEFREFLEHVSADQLKQFAHECLDRSFDHSGLALQDVINQIGTRLGFVVEAGRYR